MKKIYYVLALAGIIMVGCNGNGGGGDAALQREVDSLRRINAQNEADLNNMTAFVTTLSDGMRAIADQENTLFYDDKGPEGTMVSREQLQANLQAFANTLSEQRTRIKQLADSLRAKGMNMEKLQNMIDYLNGQLDQKDQMISQLKSELQNKNADIAQLRSKVSALTQQVRSHEQAAQQQQVAQAKASTCYVVVGSAGALKEAGIVSGGGLLAKKKVSADLPQELFTKQDMRKFLDLQIPSAKPKILSAMPKGSYTITKTGKNESLLKITDPDAFWSNTIYLIIQTK